MQIVQQEDLGESTAFQVDLGDGRKAYLVACLDEGKMSVTSGEASGGIITTLQDQIGTIEEASEWLLKELAEGRAKL